MVNNKHHQAETPVGKVLSNNSKLSLQKFKSVVNYAPHQNRVCCERQSILIDAELIKAKLRSLKIE